jgi:GTPase SAR1 family protein
MVSVVICIHLPSIRQILESIGEFILMEIEKQESNKEPDNICIFVIGMAGSGKTTFVSVHSSLRSNTFR